MIASDSYASSLFGDYYLSGKGVIRERESGTLERYYIPELISSELDNFNRLSVDVKESAVGFTFDDKYFLSFPAIGTTYVYHELAEGWATSSMVFSGATVRRDTMLFFRGNTVYVYGRSETDDGNNIGVAIKSVPLFEGSNFTDVMKVGLWLKGGTDSLASLYMHWLDHEDRRPNSLIQFHDLSKRYFKRAIKSGTTGLYLQYVIGNAPWDNLDSVAIDGIDIYYIKGGEHGVD